MFRHPHTFQEFREDAALDAEAHSIKNEFGIVIKGRRSSKNAIPTTWDDLFSHTERSWKNYRHSRYKGVACVAQ